MKNVKIPWKNGCFLPLSRHEWQVMGLKKVLYSYLVPEMILEKFHEKWMLGSAKTKGPPLSLTTSVKVANPFAKAGSSARCRRPVVGRCPLRPLTITLPSCASPPHSGTASFAFFPISDPPPFGYCAGIVPIKNFLPNLTRFLFTVPRKTTPDMYTFLETCLFTSTTRGTMPKLWYTKKCYKRYFDQISFRESRQKPWEWKCLNRSWAITSDSSFPCSGQLE